MPRFRPARSPDAMTSPMRVYSLGDDSDSGTRTPACGRTDQSSVAAYFVTELGQGGEAYAAPALRHLRAAQIVSTERDGRIIRYLLADHPVRALLVRH